MEDFISVVKYSPRFLAVGDSNDDQSYTSQTYLNIDPIFWHTQWLVTAVKCKIMITSWWKSIQTSVRPKLGFSIGNRNQGQVSVLGPDLFLLNLSFPPFFLPWFFFSKQFGKHALLKCLVCKSHWYRVTSLFHVNWQISL